MVKFAVRKPRKRALVEVQSRSETELATTCLEFNTLEAVIIALAEEYQGFEHRGRAFCHGSIEFEVPGTVAITEKLRKDSRGTL